MEGATGLGAVHPVGAFEALVIFPIHAHLAHTRSRALRNRGFELGAVVAGFRGVAAELAFVAHQTRR